MRVAVTGASGFVGGAVCRLLREHGWQVHAFGRRRAVPPDHVAGAGYRSWNLATGPLHRPPEVDAVVHAAGYVSDAGPGGPLGQVLQGDPGRRAVAVNVDGTGHVIDTWPAARLVLVSSASVYHPDRPQRYAAEGEAPDPATVRWPSAYGPTKALAERLVLQRHPAAVVLRPHAVYGPGDTTLLPRVTAAVRGRTLLLPGSGRQRHSLTRVEQLAEACRLACTAPDAALGRVYNIADAEPVVLAEALGEALAARGRPVRVVPVGRRAAAAAAALSQWRHRRSSDVHEGLTPYAAGHLARDRTFDLTLGRQLLGYHPQPTRLDDAARW